MPSLKQIDDSKTRPNDDAPTGAALTSTQANHHKRKRPSNEKQECRGSIVVHARPASRIERTLNDSSINFSSVPVASQSSLAHGNIQNRWKDNTQNFIFSSFDVEASNRNLEGGQKEAAKPQQQTQNHLSCAEHTFGTLKSLPEQLLDYQQQTALVRFVQQEHNSNTTPKQILCDRKMGHQELDMSSDDKQQYSKTPSLDANGSTQSSGESTQETQNLTKSVITSSEEGKCTDEKCEDDELIRALELSRQQASSGMARRQVQEDEELREAIRISYAMSRHVACSSESLVGSPSSEREVIELLDDDNDEDNDLQLALKRSLETARADEVRQTGSYSPLYNNLSRDEFQKCFDEWFLAQGGIDKVEKGSIVQEGNNWNDFRRGVSKEDTRNQERAQYGRLSIPALYNILDSLTGALTSSGLHPDSVGKIEVFEDIGMGIGVQVLQAAFVYGFISRGIEIMNKRFMLANELLEAFKGYFRGNPPDASKIEMLQGDFARAFPDGIPDKDGEPDLGLRSFLLCQDLSLREQKHLVVFANNAADVFDARSNDGAAGRSLDSFLAEMFGNMKVGVRFVTLTSLTKCLERCDWWREDVMELGDGCVSWSNKPQKCYVLTKLKDMWRCCDCGESSNAIDDSGRLQVDCVYCQKMPPRSSKRRDVGVYNKH